jgi:sugar lactone lactonase YvrE
MAIGLVAVGLGAAPATAARTLDATGQIDAAGAPLAGADVILWRAASTPGGARVAARTRSNTTGRFRLRVPGIGENDVLYLTAMGGRARTSRGARPVPPALVLATALGRQRPRAVTINERTTVATGFALAQFLEGGAVGGPDPGRANAAAMVRNLVDLRSGDVSALMRRPPNGRRTSTVATMNTLANVLAACAADARVCRRLVALSSGEGSNRGGGTLQAVARIAMSPATRATEIYRLQGRTRVYAPRREKAPVAWMMGVTFTGDGRQFRGPGNIAFDASGRVWTTNNYAPATDPRRVCPGRSVLRLDPYGAGGGVREFRGGGINGAGFGIGIDPGGDIWVGNFGFTGTRCTEPPPSSDSVTRLSPQGRPLTGPRGESAGGIRFPQGTVSDPGGTIWIASCGSRSVVRYPGGDPRRVEVLRGTDDRPMRDPFDVVIDRRGNGWVTSSGTNEVFAFAPDGSPLPGSPYSGGGMSKPLGIATDALGNQWVANSGVIPIPCSDDAPASWRAPAVPAAPTGTITRVTEDGRASGHSGGGLTIPWGIAVDGAGNAWVANFGGRRVSHFCGAASACPRGLGPGDALSPDTGYPFSGLQRNTGINIDASGNVWLANNWKDVPVPSNPGGNGLVAFVGMAPPVSMPLIGPPVRP